MRSFAQRPGTLVTAAEAQQSLVHLRSSSCRTPWRSCFFRPAQHTPSPTSLPLLRLSALPSCVLSQRCCCAAHTHALRRCSTGGAATHEVISPEEIDFVEMGSSNAADAVGDGCGGSDENAAPSFVAMRAWRCTQSPALPTDFADVEVVDAFARARMLSFARRYSSSSRSSSSEISPSGSALGDAKTGVSVASAEFVTEELPSGGVFHARLRIPVTRDGLRFVGIEKDEQSITQLWAHGVANTAKDAELLAAMHAERMADLLGYHVYSLPSKQRKHAAAARQAGRYASSPDDAGSGPTPQSRLAQWPLPLRRILSDEETEGGKWQLVDTSAVGRYVGPAHTILSPCLLDPDARARVVAKFGRAPSTCPSFAAQLRVEKVRTLTASSAAEGGAEFVLAHLTLPPELTMLEEPVVASGKAVDRETAVWLACMHAELLLDALHVPLFENDAALQAQHTAAAWSFGRPAPLAGAKVRRPSHVHLPDPLKQLVVGDQRTSLRSAEEEFFHRHGILTEQTATFVETTVGEATAVEVLGRFLESHNAPRATAAFVQMPVADRIKSTVLLPLPEKYGIRGGVGIATNARDADVLAAMHALDVLCLLGFPVLTEPDKDTTWKAARRERVAGVPDAVEDAAASSPPARRCSAKAFTATVDVGENAVPSTTNAPAQPSAPAAGRRRVVKRAKLASEAKAEGADSAATSADATELVEASSQSSAVGDSEARLAVVRDTVDPEYWDLKADSPDGYIMISPAAQQASSAAAEYAIASPRRLDKQAKSRVIQYLSSVGRRLDDVRVKQTLSEDDTEGRQRHRCALKVPLPAICGEPRLALGEADTAADAEHAACMHVELLLDALGVCLYTDVVKQARHAEACAQWGRWAPSGPGQERASSTPSPPPLRREYAGSLHWERKQAASERRGRGFAGKLSAAAASAAPRESPVAAVVTTGEVNVAAAEADDAASYELIGEAEIDPVARARVQYFLRHENLAAATVTYTTATGRSCLLHIATFSLPVPPRFGATQEDAATASPPLAYVAKGAATTRKDADALAWMHAERLLDALQVPLFPNLPLLQAYHATQAEKDGRTAPANTSDPPLPLTPPDQLAIKPLRLHNDGALSRLNMARPITPTAQEATSPVLWERYISACELYIASMQRVANNTYFSEDRVPRTGDLVIDAALDEAEAAPSNNEARSLLNSYAKALNRPDRGGWVVRVAGELHHRVTYATLPVPGFEHVTARGVASNRQDAQRRAAQHAIAILRRIDPDYEVRYAAAKHELTVGVNKTIDHENDLSLAESDSFDLDTFSTLPSISSEAQRVSEMRSRRFARRLRDMFAGDSAFYAHDRKLSDDGKRRAMELYTLCCGIAKPVERTLVRLLPRVPAAAVEAEGGKTGVPTPARSLTLEVQVGTLDTEDPFKDRVKGGAVYSAEVSITDENHRVWSATASGNSPDENVAAAYEKLFDAVKLEVREMEPLEAILRGHVYLRPAEVPVVEIPAAVSELMQRCLRNQKDLLLAENDTSAVDAEKMAADAAERALARRQLEKGSTTAAPADPTELSEGERAAVEAAESAALLEQMQQRITNPVYLEKYASKRASLSIARHKSEILRTIRDNPIVVICGTTGCGKTTQIPQYILDEATQAGAGGRCRILITQPRRISATSIANRVAAERLENVGESVGYSIRFDNRMGRHINYVTTGVLLRAMHSSSLLPETTHVIIDEIHERDLFTDFMLVLLRDLVVKRPDIRIVLMSATLQASDFQRYFGNAPLIKVEGHVFPVKELFLEDLVPYAREHNVMTPLLKEAATVRVSDALATSQPLLDVAQRPAGSNFGSARYQTKTVRSRLDFPTICFAVEQAARMIDLRGSSILVFLPGWEEIKMLQSLLERDSRNYVLPLHSALGPEAQLRCFQPAPAGKTKIIVSTNIAESGVTIDDVAVVIDCGRAREKSFATRVKTRVARQGENGFDAFVVSDSDMVTAVDDSAVVAQNRFSRLVEVYISRANCVQRRGRVGRTRPGLCIRLYTREHFETLHDFQTPEMLRVPLDRLCLEMLNLHITSPQEFLAGAMSPPLASEVTAAMARLADLGAVSAEGQLTALGRRLASIAAPPAVGKMLLVGVALRCLDTALTLAAADEAAAFASTKEERMYMNMHREDLSMDSLSDAIANVNAYNFWAASQRHRSPAQVALDIKSRFLSIPGLLKLTRLKSQYLGMLVDLGFVSMQDYKATHSDRAAYSRYTGALVDVSDASQNALDVGLVKAVVATGCYPNVGILCGKNALRSSFENMIHISAQSILQRSHLNEQSNPFVVYGELSKGSLSNVLEVSTATSVSFWAIFFMSSRNVTMEYLQELSLCVVNNCFFFRVSYRTLEQIRRFKSLLDRRLSRKFVVPDDAVNNAELDAITGVLSKLFNAPYKPSPELFPTLVWAERGAIISPTEAPKASTEGQEQEAADQRGGVNVRKV